VYLEISWLLDSAAYNAAVQARL